MTGHKIAVLRAFEQDRLNLLRVAVIANTDVDLKPPHRVAMGQVGHCTRDQFRIRDNDAGSVKRFYFR